MLSVRRVLLLFLLSGVLGQDEFASDCPEPNGFFADAVQCDKYYKCVEGVLTEKLCPDGMVFNDINPRVENCDFPFQIPCEGRPELQKATASTQCPRLNGYFAHEKPDVCNEFYYCSAGIGSHITCPEGLVFSLKTGTCVWPNESGRVGCTSQNVLNFTCPSVEFEVAVAHPRYSDPDDCQYFYVCINGDTPRRNGCKFGEVFNNKTKACDQPINVPDCKDYYKEYFEEYFSNLGTGGIQHPTPDILAAAIGSGFTLPDRPKRVKISGDNSPRRRKPIDAAAAADTPVGEDKPVSVRARPLPIQETDAPSLDSLREEVAQPVRTRQPSAGGTLRRPLGRRRTTAKTAAAAATTTTTTTTTTTSAPSAAKDDYYYDYDYPEGGAAAPAAEESAAAPRKP